MNSNQPVLNIKNLTVAYRFKNQLFDAVRDFSLEIFQGQIYGIVGESGSGKTTVAMAVLQYLIRGAEVRNGEIIFKGNNLLRFSTEEMDHIWGSDLCLVPQNTQNSLNPSIRAGDQVIEILIKHEKLNYAESLDKTLALFKRVGFDDPLRVSQSYPHQISGGMQQRIAIAMALSTNPSLIIFDEPTTNLDVTTQASLLRLIRELINERNTAAIYITHNLAVVAQICDRVSVMYASELVEDASIKELLTNPLHPYTRGLLESVPRMGDTKKHKKLVSIKGQIPTLENMPSGCVFAPRCVLKIDECEIHPAYSKAEKEHFVRCHRWEEIKMGYVDMNIIDEDTFQIKPLPANLLEAKNHYPPVLEIKDLSVTFNNYNSLLDLLRNRPYSQLTAVDGINFQIKTGEIVGLVGESGSGKTSLASAIVGLVQTSSGEMVFMGEQLPPKINKRNFAQLKQMQMIFQNPDESLNPYQTIGETLSRPYRKLLGYPSAEAKRAVLKLLSTVRLPEDYIDRMPSQLSGGEKQRVALARVFATNPKLLIADEPVSSLDVSLRAAILNLLEKLQAEQGNSLLIISHDLAVVSYLADVVVVIYHGQLMELTRIDELFLHPHHPYTEALLEAVPVVNQIGMKGKVTLQGETRGSNNYIAGCPFYFRCPRLLGEICGDETPPWQGTETGKQIFCHIPLQKLSKKNR